MANPLPGLRTRAQARLAALKTRSTLMAAAAALTQRDRLTMLHEAATADRVRVDGSTADRIADLTRQTTAAENALQFTPPDRLEAARAGVQRLNEDLTGAIDDRVKRMGDLNDRIVELTRERRETENALADALRELRLATTNLHDLLEKIGHPEAMDLIECVSRQKRAARAAYLLELMRGEVANAQAQLARVGESREYDQALSDLIDAEINHALARRARDNAARQCEWALRVYMRNVQALNRVAPAPPPPTVVRGSLNGATEDGTVILDTNFVPIVEVGLAPSPADALGSAAVSEGGEQPEAPASQGPGTPVVGPGGSASAPPSAQCCGCGDPACFGCAPNPDLSAPAPEVAHS